MTRRYRVTRQVVRGLFWTAAGLAFPGAVLGATWLVGATS